MKRNNHTSSVPCVFALLVALFLATTPSVLADEPIRIGVLAPLTGGVSEFGVAAQNGIRLALKESPKRLSSVEFLFEDTKFEGKTALSAYYRLLSRGDVALYFVWGHPPAQALAPLAEKKRTPILAVTPMRDFAQELVYVERFYFHGGELGKPLLEYLRAQGYKKLGLVKTDFIFFNSILESMRKALNASEALDVVQVYHFDDFDFRTAVSKLKEADFDAIGVFLASGQVGSFFRQAKDLQLRPPFFGTDFFESETEIKDARGYMDGAVYPAIDATPEFRERYLTEYGNDRQVAQAAHAYDFALLAGDLAKTWTSKTSARQIMESFRGMSRRAGATGDFWFEQGMRGAGEFRFHIVMKKIDGERFVPIDRDANTQ